MNEIQRYLAEEIALDCSAGHISRFEALRRLRVMGVSAAVAAALLAACGVDEASAPAAPTAAIPAAQPNTARDSDPAGIAAAPSDASAADENAGSESDSESASAPSAPPADMTVTGGTPASPAAQDLATQSGVGMGLPTEAITFEGPRGTLQGAWASPAAPRGAVLVIHENRGLNDHIRTVAGRFAAAGYAALALDLLSEEGGTASLGDVANATAALGAAPPERFVADMQAALGELERRAPGTPIGAIGFCFGGGMIWRLLASGDTRLKAAAPFYGPLPQGAMFAGSQAAVLAVYGELDARVNASQGAAETALTTAALEHELVTFPGANHAFFNDTGGNYNPAAAAEAWVRVLSWFAQYLN